MSLIYCPECGHEISNAAIACPNCGRPISTRPAPTPPLVVERKADPDSIPPWVIAPVILLGVLVAFGLIYLFMSGDSDRDAELSVNVNARRTTTSREDDRPATSSATTTTSVPSSESSGTSYPTTTQNIPGSTGDVPQATTGKVIIEAKVASATGRTEPVRNIRFYLLDKDVETILRDADLEPLEGRTLADSLALATAAQSRYAAFYREAMQALREHIKYTGSTDSMGKAQLGSVEPDSYYLFGVARTGEGFAMWSSQVSVIAGDNAVNLAPQTITRMPSGAGEE